MAESHSLPPSGLLALAIPANSADHDLLEALRPPIADPQALTPLRYRTLLLEAQVVLQQLGTSSEEAVFLRAASLLAEELQLLQGLEQRRRSPAGT